MTDLERLTKALDALNVNYEKTASANGADINIIWIFTFDAAGKMKEVISDD